MAINKSPWTHEEFKDIFSRVPRACVEVAIKTDDGILLTLRKKYSYIGQWHMPGGSVYYRERLHDTVKRVAFDELGIEVTVEKLLGVIEYFSEEKEKGFGYSLGIVFLCRPLSTKFRLNDQASEARFFKLLPPNMVEEQKKFIDEHLDIK